MYNVHIKNVVGDDVFVYFMNFVILFFFFFRFFRQDEPQMNQHCHCVWVRLRLRIHGSSAAEMEAGALIPKGKDAASPKHVDDFLACSQSKQMRSIERQLQLRLNNLQKWSNENGVRFSSTKLSVSISVLNEFHILNLYFFSTSHQYQ